MLTPALLLAWPCIPACLQVLVRWACDKISAAAASLPDDQLMEALQVGGGALLHDVPTAASSAVTPDASAAAVAVAGWNASLLSGCCSPEKPSCVLPAHPHPSQAKLAGQWGVKYAAVAAHAASEGRTGLAALLLEHERVAAEQVPLLLELGVLG